MLENTYQEGQGTKIPASAEAEAAVLGSILIDGESLRLVEWLRPEDFYIQRYAWIYAAAQALRQAGQDVDYLTISDRLERTGKLAEVGGPVGIMKLINATPSSVNIESYARLVKEKAADRKILDIAGKLARLAYDNGTDKRSAISAAIEDLAHVGAIGAQAVPWSEYLSRLYDEVDAATRNPIQGLTGIPTGLPDWDAITGGLQPGTVTKLTGDPGLGKSVLAMQVLVAGVAAGHPGAMYELEMSMMQVTRRKVAAETGITTRDMRRGTLEDKDIPVFTHAIEKLSDLGVYVSENTHLTTADLRVDLYRLKENYGVELAVIDYEGLLKDEARDRDEHSRIVSERVHDIAKDLNIAILSIGDMTKQGIQGMVQGQGAMAGTGRELHNADDIMLMRKDGKTDNQVIVTWEKLREPEGDARFMYLTRRPGFPAFFNPPKARV